MSLLFTLFGIAIIKRFTNLFNGVNKLANMGTVYGVVTAAFLIVALVSVALNLIFTGIATAINKKNYSESSKFYKHPFFGILLSSVVQMIFIQLAIACVASALLSSIKNVKFAQSFKPIMLGGLIGVGLTYGVCCIIAIAVVSCFIALVIYNMKHPHSSLFDKLKSKFSALDVSDNQNVQKEFTSLFIEQLENTKEGVEAVCNKLEPSELKEGLLGLKDLLKKIPSCGISVSTKSDSKTLLEDATEVLKNAPSTVSSAIKDKYSEGKEKCSEFKEQYKEQFKGLLDDDATVSLES